MPVLSRRSSLVGMVAVLVAHGAHAATLYDDLGGHAGLTRIIDRLFALEFADRRVADKFDDINIERLKGRIVELICQTSGGPCVFHGVSMKGAHAYLHLTDAHFKALVEDLQTAMDDCGVAYRTQNRLLALLAPMRRDIVTQ